MNCENCGEVVPRATCLRCGQRCTIPKSPEPSVSSHTDIDINGEGRALDREYMQRAFTNPYLQFKAVRVANDLKRQGQIMAGNIILEAIKRWQEADPSSMPSDLGQSLGFKSDGDMMNNLDTALDCDGCNTERNGSVH